MTEDQGFELAAQMRAANVGWLAISRMTGLSVDVLRYRLDATFAERRRAHSRAKHLALRQERAGPIVHAQRDIRPQDAALALAKVQPDTRSLMAKFFGDPLPGRSALDRKRRADFSPQSTLLHRAGTRWLMKR